jgi:hypothetical protein
MMGQENAMTAVLFGPFRKKLVARPAPGGFQRNPGRTGFRPEIPFSGETGQLQPRRQTGDPAGIRGAGPAAQTMIQMADHQFLITC